MTRAQAGDVDAFAELYALYYGFVLNYARRRHPDAAEDIAQDVFVKALANLHQWRDQGKNPRAWLAIITANLCRDWAKSYAYRHVTPCDFTDPAWSHYAPPDPEPDPGVVAVRTTEVERMRVALAQVSDPQRVALVGFYLRGMSIRQLSVQMGSPENAVRQVLHRGRRAMAQLLRHHETNGVNA